MDHKYSIRKVFKKFEYNTPIFEFRIVNEFGVVVGVLSNEFVADDFKRMFKELK